MVTYLDKLVGEVLAKLKELGLEENTIVLFTSDNGPQPGAWSDIFVEYFDGNGPYRGAKTNFYEGGIRVPLLVRWPGKIKAGSTSDFVGYFADVMPTLADLAGAADKLPKNLDGISFAPTLLGEKGAAKGARVPVLGGRRDEAGHRPAGGAVAELESRQQSRRRPL
jgi:arylsulfatase A-like enzyme